MIQESDSSSYLQIKCPQLKVMTKVIVELVEIVVFDYLRSQIQQFEVKLPEVIVIEEYS